MFSYNKSKKRKSKKKKRSSKLLTKRNYFNKDKPETTDDTQNNKISEYKNRLKSSQFRILNEYLYTKNSKNAESYFSKNPDEFDMVRIPQINFEIFYFSKF